MLPLNYTAGSRKAYRDPILNIFHLRARTREAQELLAYCVAPL